MSGTESRCWCLECVPGRLGVGKMSVSVLWGCRAKEEGSSCNCPLTENSALWGTPTSGSPHAQTGPKSGKIRVNGVRGNVIHLGLPSLRLDLDLLFAYQRNYQFSVAHPSTSSSALTVSGPWPHVLKGIFRFLAVVAVVSGILRHCLQPVRPFTLSILPLKCLSICSFLCSYCHQTGPWHFSPGWWQQTPGQAPSVLPQHSALGLCSNLPNMSL